MHFRHVTGSPRSGDEGTDKKANGPQWAKTEKPKKEEKEKGWTAVERMRRGGRAKAEGGDRGRPHPVQPGASRFLATPDVGRTVGPPVAKEGEEGASEATEWEDREREEQLALLREEVERLGGEE